MSETLALLWSTSRISIVAHNYSTYRVFGDILCMSEGSAIALLFKMRDDYEAERRRLHVDHAALVARVANLEQMLEDLTPGGSEFHGNPQRCRDFVKRSMATVIKTMLENKKLVERVAELEAQLAAARRWEPVEMDNVCIALGYGETQPLPDGYAVCRVAGEGEGHE